MEVKYITENKGVAFVSSGISGGKYWMAVYQKDPFFGTHRIVSKLLPIRQTKEEAQRDLDIYAKKKGWVKAEDDDRE